MKLIRTQHGPGLCPPANTNVPTDHGQPARRSRILLALHEHGNPPSAVTRAAALAQRSDSELQVVRILSQTRQVAGGVSVAGSQLGDIRRRQATRLSTLDWVAKRLRRPVRDQNVWVDAGAFLDSVAVRAGVLDARLIVVPGRALGSGEAIASLALATRTPVLVARGRLQAGPVLSATDLQDDSFHVLNRSAEIGRLVKAPCSVLVTPIPRREVQ